MLQQHVLIGYRPESQEPIVVTKSGSFRYQPEARRGEENIDNEHNGNAKLFSGSLVISK
jgi:hypothetical protein